MTAMASVAYSASKREFIDDCRFNRFLDKMCEGAALNGIGVRRSERLSWQNNAEKVRNLLDSNDIPDDVHIAFEYYSKNGGRVDCMLFGVGKDSNKHIIHIELKQWSNDKVTEVYGTGVFHVTALVNGRYQMLIHPSKQAYGYQQHISNYVTAVNKPGNRLNGYAYCYNYKYSKKPNDLFADQYKPVMQKCPLNAGDQVESFANLLRDLLSGGKGADIFKEFISSPIKPSKNLMKAAADIFKGQDEFVLLDNQLTSSNCILGMVEEVIANPKRKMALIVKGGPGTGKTVIALKVLAELAAKYPKLTTYFTSRSKALRNTLKDKLDSITASGNTSAADLIRDIYDFKPHNFLEGEVDVLLVDEAHRIRKSSNVMYDSKGEQTYLSQVLSLMYCSKVCVFFIDDRQGVNKEEIGLSSVLSDTAKDYHSLIEEQTRLFREELAKNKTKLSLAFEKRDELLKDKCTMDTKEFLNKFNRIQKRIETLRDKIAKEYQLNDINNSITDVRVETIELETQFRCNGSDNYLDWIDNVLYNDKAYVEEHKTTFGNEYQVEICETPAELEQKIRALNQPVEDEKQIARIVAGYCWKWSDKLQKNGDLYKDVVIGDWSMPWETNNVQARKPYYSQYAPSADLWASHPMGINQVGCIFSAQGFEVDYIGVILGPDIAYDSENHRIMGIKGKTHSVSTADPDFEQHIKNIYRVLLTRGKRGCLIYCCDEALGNYFKKLLNDPGSEIDGVSEGNSKVSVSYPMVSAELNIIAADPLDKYGK